MIQFLNFQFSLSSIPRDFDIFQIKVIRIRLELFPPSVVLSFYFIKLLQEYFKS